MTFLFQERQELLESWRAKAKANGKGTSGKSKYNRNTHINDQLLDMDEDDVAEEGYILNKARADDEEPVRICPHISRFLKPHQVCSSFLYVLVLTVQSIGFVHRCPLLLNEWKQGLLLSVLKILRSVI